MSEVRSTGQSVPISSVLHSSSAARHTAPASAAPLTLTADRIEPAVSAHGFGAGILVGASAEAGLLGGIGASASAGAGIFSHDARTFHSGSFAGAGTLAGGRPGVVGIFAGAGVGAFVTNAESAQQLGGVAQTYAVNIGVGPVKVSAQFGSSDGTYIGSLSVGPGIGLDVSRYPTHTVTRSW